MFESLHTPALLDYPQNYQHARTRFLELLGKLAYPVQHDAVLFPVTGAQGEALYLDTVWVGNPDAANLLVLISATHGVEGFAGAAIQQDVLHQLARTVLPEDTAVLLLHALNPWGFSFQQRVNEDGVDLNRNGVDFFQALPVNADYSLLADDLQPADGDWEAANLRLKQQIAGWSDERRRKAVTGGQYTHPHGLFYGGTRPSFSRQVLERKLAEWQLAHRQVVVLDLHTGLGPFGHGELVCDHPLHSVASRKAQAWFGNLVTLPEAGDSCSVPLLGLMDYLWHAAMREDGIFLTLEYGTYPFLRMLDGLRRKQGLGEIFNPDSALWREMVLLRARQVIRVAWQNLQAGEQV
jgi:hypothetical protein